MWQHVVVCVLSFALIVRVIAYAVDDWPVVGGRKTETCRSVLRNFKKVLINK